MRDMTISPDVMYLDSEDEEEDWDLVWISVLETDLRLLSTPDMLAHAVEWTRRSSP